MPEVTYQAGVFAKQEKDHEGNKLLLHGIGAGGVPGAEILPGTEVLQGRTQGEAGGKRGVPALDKKGRQKGSEGIVV